MRPERRTQGGPVALSATDILSMYAGVHPDKLAVVEGDHRVSYFELNRMANRQARVLQDLGVKAGTTVVWCGQNGMEVVSLVHAARKSGAVSVPLNYRLSPDEAHYVIDNSDATIVLFDVEQTDQLKDGPANCPKVTTWIAFRCTADQVPEWAVHLESLADVAPEDDVTPVGAADTS